VKTALYLEFEKSTGGGNIECEGIFWAVSLVINHLRNSIGDKLPNYCLVSFNGNDIFCNVRIDDMT
jgi:hypothetical protein